MAEAASTQASAGQSAETILLGLIKSQAPIETSELLALFERLQPADEAFMLGQWHGGKFRGEGNTVENWYGKRFVSRDEVNPMLCTHPDGEIFAWQEWGQARMREVAYGGHVQAAIVYDQRPLMDYFRKLDDETVIGLADIKGRPLDFFFWLRRDPAGKTHR